MRSSQLVAGLVIACSIVWLAGALVTLALTTLRPTTIAALLVVVIAVVAASGVGVRSRRWLSNPYW